MIDLIYSIKFLKKLFIDILIFKFLDINALGSGPINVAPVQNTVVHNYNGKNFDIFEDSSDLYLVR